MLSKIHTVPLTLLAFAWCHSAGAQTLQWARQFASASHNAIFGTAADSSGVYVVGVTRGALPGQTAVSIQQDGFLRKYDPAGKELWTKEFAFNPAAPIARPFSANGVAVDASGVYVAGTIGIEATDIPARRGGPTGALSVVGKFDLNGNLLWTKQAPPSGTPGGEGASGVAVSGGAVYVVGSFTGIQNNLPVSGAYLRKFDAAGNVQWTSQAPGLRVTGYGVAADASGAYIVGTANSSLTTQQFVPLQDLFVRKYDTSGNVQWTDQFGSGFGPEYILGVSASSSGVYVVGTTPGLLGIETLPAFGQDAWVRNYDSSSGKVQWTRQFGTIANESAFGVFADDGGAYVVGYTQSVLGTASIGAEDAFLRRYDSNGNALWTLQTGSVNDDYGFGVAADASGVYIGGYTDRQTIPETLRVADSFVYKYSPPAPGGPVISEGGIVNNASFAPNPAPVAPGSIAAIFGTGLNDGSQVLSSAFGPDGKLVTTLGGASVTVGGFAAPMFYSTSGQLGIQIPVELAGQQSADVQVTVNGQVSQPRKVALSVVKPGLFTVGQDGRGTVVCLHTDGITPVTADNRAHPNEIVIFYGTGFGTVNPALGTGVPSSGNTTVALPMITIDGLQAHVEFTGVAPGFVGLNQLNVTVPGLARTNPADPVVLTINGVQANAVTLPVGPP